MEGEPQPSVFRPGGVSYLRIPCREPVRATPYVYVDDLDATLERIEANGGALSSSPRPEGTLRVATFRDPEGNLVGVWTQTAMDRNHLDR